MSPSARQHGRPISIHALRKESDPRITDWKNMKRISIHALRKESDGKAGIVNFAYNIFQSTLSVRRATRRVGCIITA